ncbi:hypothetical protein N1851_022341 [Merluccius polli]|uniref:Uncharacterized protein n=1 Tax=Merluccius polli TaxID=89951 RepID=A0AA47NVY0_MERPO|nr:hypothetical protein N1851_022341 [Merluccius polli]
MSGVLLPVVLLLLASAPGLARSSGPGLTWALADPDPDSVVHQGEAVDVSVLWDHLRGLKELVLRLSQQAVDQRLTLRSMETRVQDQHLKFQEHTEQIRGLETLQVQLNTTRDQLLGLTWSRTDDLEQQNSAQDAQLLALETRMEAREAEVDDLKNKNTELLGELPFLKTRLRASESTLEQQRRRNAVLSARMCSAENQMEELRRQRSVELVTWSPVFPVVRPGDGSGAPGGSELAELQTRMGSCSAQLEVLQNQSRDTLVSMESRLLSMETRLVSAEMSLDSAPIQVEPPMAENTAKLAAVRGKLRELDGRLTDQKSMLSALEVQMNASTIWTEAMESRARSNETTLLELQKQVSDHTSQLLRVETRVNISQSLLEHLKTQQNTVSDLEASGSATRRQLEELQELTKAQEAELVAMAARLAAGESQREVLESRLDVEEAALETLKTESSVSLGFQQLFSLLPDHTSQLLRVETRVNISQSLLEHLKTQQNTGTPAEVQLTGNQ